MRITTFDQYVQAVLRTEAVPPSFDPGMPVSVQWRSASPTLFARLLHAVMGLVTEVGELFEPVTRLAEHYEVCGGFDPDCEGAYADYQNMREEIGDLWWYTALLCHAVSRDLGVPDRPEGLAVYFAAAQATPRSLVSQHHAMSAEVGDMMDTLKRARYYRFDQSVFSADELQRLSNLAEEWVTSLVLFTEHFIGAYGCDIPDALRTIWSENITKLQTRYPEKFTTDRAFNRDVVAEASAVAEAPDVPKCICQGFYRPPNCPVHGAPHHRKV